MKPSGQPSRRVTVSSLRRASRLGRKIVMLTAYDCPTARILDDAGVDVVLVGDSLGMVLLGYDTTAPVTIDEMAHHARAVRRGVRRAMVIVDLPLMSLRSVRSAVRDARLMVRELRCDAVKVEWGPGILARVRAIIQERIPVLGHAGLTPQLVTDPSQFRVKGRRAEDAAEIIRQAEALEDAGCFGLVLECVPDRVAELITQRVRIPTIGIGAGPRTTGQVLVLHDLLGIRQGMHPRFVKSYETLDERIGTAVRRYCDDVRRGTYPSRRHSYHISNKEFQRLLELVGSE